MLSRFNRILIIGCSGSGKSTLARRLGRIIDLPVVHLDREYFRPAWNPLPDAEFDEVVERLVAGDRWIIDGNFARTLPRRISRADMVIHLDFPRWRCLYGVITRVFKAIVFDQPRPDMADGCAEKWDWEFIEWVWNFHAHSRPKVLECLAACDGRVKVMTLRSRDEVAAWLNGPFPLTCNGHRLSVPTENS